MVELPKPKKRPQQAAQDFINHKLDKLPEQGLMFTADIQPTAFHNIATFIAMRNNNYSEIFPLLAEIEKIYMTSVIQQQLEALGHTEHADNMLLYNSISVTIRNDRQALQEHFGIPAEEAEDMLRMLKAYDDLINKQLVMPKLIPILQLISQGADASQLPSDWRQLLQKGNEQLDGIVTLVGLLGSEKFNQEAAESDPTIADMEEATRQRIREAEIFSPHLAETLSSQEARNINDYALLKPQVEQLAKDYADMVSTCVNQGRQQSADE